MVGIGPEIRENLVDVDAVAAVFGAQGRVVRPGVGNAEGGVRFHCAVDGTVVPRIHGFNRSEGGDRAEPHHRLGGNDKRYEDGVYHLKRCTVFRRPDVNVVIFYGSPKHFHPAAWPEDAIIRTFVG